jgi:hypothetical protein
MMKHQIQGLFAVLGLLTVGIVLSGLSSQDKAPASKPVQISIRVFDQGRFVDSIGAADLEVFDNGIPQNILGFSLFDRGRMVRSEGDPALAPKTGRHFTVYFQMTEFEPKFEEAFKFLFTDILTENDSLTLVTPMKPYFLTSQAFKQKSKDALARETLKLVRKDILEGASDYRSLLNDLKRIARAIGGNSSRSGDIESEGDPSANDYGLEFLLPRYKHAMTKMENLRFTDESKFLAVAEELRQATAPVQVIFFYQREFRPEIHPNTLSLLMLSNQDRPDLQAGLAEVFQFYRRELNFNVDRIGKAMADAGAPFYALFLNRQPKSVAGLIMTEQSEDMYKLFTEITRTTGGFLETADNPTASLRKTAQLGSQTYYLSFLPQATADGSYRTITVRVKDKPFTVAHRQGYYAR